MIFNRSARLFLTHTLLLLSGGLVGLGLAIFLSTLPWDFSADLERARQLGVVSETILGNYPKRLDLLSFVLVMVMTVCGALIFWMPWGLKRRELLCDSLFENDSDKWILESRNLRPLVYAMAVVGLISIYFNINNFYDSYWMESVGAWSFLGEEGEFLEWTNRIMSGDVQGKDFFCLYGPLMVYPLAWLQKLAGPVVSLGRWYTFALNLCSYILLAYLLNRILKTSVVGLLSLLLMTAIYPYNIYSPNISPLRVLLGLAPLLFLIRCNSGGSLFWYLATGMTVGGAFLYSQEIGVCALVASSVYLGFRVCLERSAGEAVRPMLAFVAGFISMVTPFLIYFGLNGALVPFLEDLFSYPRLVMLGYGGVAFPGILHALQSPLSPMVFDNYWIISVYIVILVLLLTRILMCKVDLKTMIILYIVVFGIVLFRSALGRASVEKAHFVAIPAFMLLFCYLDQGVEMVQKRSNLLAGTLMAGFTFSVSFFVVINMSLPRHHLQMFKNQVMNPHRYDYNPVGTEIAGLKRNDVRHPTGTAMEIQLIADFFSKHEAGEYVYFFPNEPAYYFLFDKKNPTRYPMSYLAVTSGMRLESVLDIEKHKPRYVVYSKTTWRPDNIMVDVQVPEIFDYIKSRYKVLQDSGEVVFLIRGQ